MSFLEFYDYISRQVPIDDLKYFLLLIFIFYMTIFAFRINGVYKKNECPKCGHDIKRTRRNLFDKISFVLLLGILPIRRYKCTACIWKGVRWNTEKSFIAKKKRRLGKRSSNASASNTTN